MSWQGLILDKRLCWTVLIAYCLVALIPTNEEALQSLPEDDPLREKILAILAH